MAKKKDFDYYQGFIQAVDYGLQAAEMLDQIVHAFNPALIETLKDEMHEIESAADAAKYEMHSYLMKEFLPPLEFTDILDLADDLDDITDSIEEVLFNIYMFNVVRLRPETQEFTRLIVKTIRVLQSAMQEFKNFRKSKVLKDQLETIMSLEEEGDRLYLASMKALTNTVIDPFEAIAWVRIYDALERCSDKLDIAATTMQSIILKNS